MCRYTTLWNVWWITDSHRATAGRFWATLKVTIRWPSAYSRISIQMIQNRTHYFLFYGSTSSKIPWKFTYKFKNDLAYRQADQNTNRGSFTASFTKTEINSNRTQFFHQHDRIILLSFFFDRQLTSQWNKNEKYVER